jgi:hypothetical protein
MVSRPSPAARRHAFRARASCRAPAFRGDTSLRSRQGSPGRRTASSARSLADFELPSRSTDSVIAKGRPAGPDSTRDDRALFTRWYRRWLPAPALAGRDCPLLEPREVPGRARTVPADEGRRHSPSTEPRGRRARSRGRQTGRFGAGSSLAASLSNRTDSCTNRSRCLRISSGQSPIRASRRS